MTEIEKLYENAGIKGEWRDYRTKNGKIYEGKNPKNRNIRLCKPRFTAEKQIELIKWLIKFNCLELWYFDSQKKAFDFDLGEINAKGATFEESLARLINNLWQDLAEQEKEEIRRILNENS